MTRRVLAVAAAALLLVACGSDDGEGRYDAQVDQVRRAVEAGDRDAALASLEELGSSAFYAHAAGDVSDEELAELDVLLDQARARLDEELPTTTTTTAAPTTTTTTTEPPAPVFDTSDEGDGDEDDEKAEKKKDRGRGGDDGDDDDDD